MTVCNNTYQNLKFDLMHGRVNPNASNSSTSPQSSTNLHAPGGSVYEIEIPRKYFDNCILPDHLSPVLKHVISLENMSLVSLVDFHVNKFMILEINKNAVKRLNMLI